MRKQNSSSPSPVAVSARKRPVRGRPSGKMPTRGNILRAALETFAKEGFAGGRIDKISKAARSTDRMIYYYFGSKERLFVDVLETVYRELGEAEAALDLSGLDPRQSLRAIIRFTWNYYLEHPEMLTLLNNENLHSGRHVTRSKRVKELSSPLLSILSNVLATGARSKEFRPDLQVQDVYIAICALGYFYLSNRFTLSAFLGADLMAPTALRHWQELIEDVILKFVSTPAAE
jgi:AcrR family transcriptional regulator